MDHIIKLCDNIYNYTYDYIMICLKLLLLTDMYYVKNNILRSVKKHSKLLYALRNSVCRYLCPYVHVASVY